MKEKDNIQIGDKVTYTIFGKEETNLLTSIAEINLMKSGIKENKIKIIRIERQKYEKVYKKQEILDEVEKKYLSNFLKPFKNRVETIVKEEIDEEQYLDIYIKDEGYINLPNFKANTMYKGMKLGKEYTLKELGLE